ncbi:MAG: DNA polymerase IV [Acutalibacter sp.]
MDMNNFYASVETLFAPEYRDVPMAVAGDQESRHGIILAKNMLAKQRGVQTAEPIWQAKRKCPELQLVKPHRERYSLYSRKAQEIYCRFTDQVEPFSLDECWLDVYGSERLFGDGEAIAQQIRRTVKEELGLTVSIGVSYNKVFAKLGSDYKKPDAVTVFGREQMESVIWKLPAQALLFVGPHTEKTLQKFGVRTIGDIARMELPAMRRMLGKVGEVLWLYANGLDNSPVVTVGAGEPPKTIGNSTTLPHDVTTEEEIRRTLLELAESVASRLRHQGMKAGEVQLTVKSGDFQEYQRQCRLEPPVCDARSLYRAALDLYRRENRRWAVRLLGLRAGKLLESDQVQTSLFDRGENGLEREERLESAVDALRERFGGASVQRGTILPGPKELSPKTGGDQTQPGEGHGVLTGHSKGKER